MVSARKPAKDRTSLIISIIFHVILIAIVGYWMHKTGKLEAIRETILKLAQGNKTEKKEPIKPVQTKQPPPAKLPPINQGYTPPSGGGTRRAVVDDAPDAIGGGSFFADTRTQTQGPATTGTGTQHPNPPKTQKIVVLTPPPPKFDLRPPVSTGRGSTAKLLAERRTAKTVSDSIGAEAIDRSTSSDAGDVVAKVTGTSVVEGKYAVVRGLSDRYTMTMLNGGDVPTPDAYRRQVQMDIFPAKMIEAVKVTKTFTPDLPGGFAGGLIDVQTRSFPDKFVFSTSAGFSYNKQANLINDFLTDQGGSLDWAGMDDGGRAMPEVLENNSLPAPPGRGGRNQDAETALARSQEAERLYEMTSSFKSSVMAPITTDSFLNQSYGAAMGDTVRLFSQPLGYFAAFDYKNGYSYYDDGVLDRYGEDLSQKRDMTQTFSSQEVSWTAMASVAYQLHPDHEVSFNFLYNQTGEMNARHAEGQNLTTGSPEQVMYLNTLNYVERNLTTYQFRGQHQFTELNGLKIDWLASASSTSQEEPDLRFFNYFGTETDTGTYNVFNANLPYPFRPTRFFREILEEGRNVKADISLPFQNWTLEDSELKVGAFYSINERSFEDRSFTYQSETADSGFTLNGTPNTYLNDEFLRYLAEYYPRRGPLNTNYTFYRYINSEIGNSKYDGDIEVTAFYAMTDLALANRLHLIGGARMETTGIEVNANPSGVLDPVNSLLDQTDVLPAVGLVWNTRSNMNVRLNYGETVARPSFREMAPVDVYDIKEDVLVRGNADLSMSSIQNFDLRWEWFPRLGEVLSLGLFYKEIQNPIEAYSQFTDNSVITFTNRTDATAYGVELELRKSLDFIHRDLAGLSVGFNFSYIQSETELTEDEYFGKTNSLKKVISKTRPLYDQSPYIMNADLTWAIPTTQTTISVSVNMAGERIYFATAAGLDVYEHPPTSLDLVVSQRLTKHWKAKFSAKNLLDSPILRTYGEEADSKYVYTEYRKGITFGLSLSAEF